jgi:hypothetical protein
VAIANHRLRDVRDGWVRVAYRNRRQGHRGQTMTLTAEALIRRFLLHVLPSGFMRLRHYGFLANRHKAHTLRRCRELLGQPSTPHPHVAQRVWCSGCKRSRASTSRHVRTVALGHSCASRWRPSLDPLAAKGLPREMPFYDSS